MGERTKFFCNVNAFHDAVTGSCIIITVCYPNKTKESFLIDCGIYQEKRFESLNKEFGFRPSNIKSILITHAHADHIGRLPLLVNQGFSGKIFATEATKELLPVALEDAYKIGKLKAKRNNEKMGYNKEDIKNVLKQVVSATTKRFVKVTEHISAMFLKNGHLAGSACIWIKISYPGEEDINILATGDYKKENIFFESDDIPEELRDEPVNVIIESTYGDSFSTEVEKTFAESVEEAVQRGATIIVPVFALGRAQEILYVIKCMQDEKKIGNVPIYFAGNLAQRYTKMYLEKLDLRVGMKHFLPKNLEIVKNIEALVKKEENGRIVLTTSEMGTFGPSQTIIPAFLSDSDALIHFTGYTAEGTLGRKILEAERGQEVKVNGKTVVKMAEVRTTGEFSSHAKADELLDFLSQFHNLKMVMVNHGEENTKESFAERVRNDPRCNAKGVWVLGRRYGLKLGRYGWLKTFPSKFGNDEGKERKKMEAKKKRVKIRKRR